MIGYVIPALNPPDTLGEIIIGLPRDTANPVVIVDDGSTETAGFDGLSDLPGVTVLRHPVNLGKGEALKTAFRHLLADTAITAIVTLDADGQHQNTDVTSIADTARRTPDQLILGVRAFTGDVPRRSRLGNSLTRAVLRALHGIDLIDSQTGLRSVPRHLAELCLASRSRRYGFELEMLILAHASGTPMLEVPIETIYIDDNAASHFRPMLDSLGVYLVFLRFSAVSLCSFIIDIALFALIHGLTSNVFASTYAARVLSGGFNFSMNRHVVFGAGRATSVWRQLSGYVLLALVIATTSATLVTVLASGLDVSPTIVKIFVDPCLFVLSFLTQRLLIFRKRG